MYKYLLFLVCFSCSANSIEQSNRDYQISLEQLQIQRLINIQQERLDREYKVKEHKQVKEIDIVPIDNSNLIYKIKPLQY